MISKFYNQQKNCKQTDLNIFLFMLLPEKSTEIFPKNKEYFFISQSFALN